MRRLMAAVGALAVVLIAPLVVSAQPLADRIPKDAIFYIGWKGADSLGPAYDASHLKAVVDASGVQAFVNDFLPKLAERAGQEDKNTAQGFAILSAVGAPLWKHPSAIYVGPFDFANPPMPHAALLCNAGADAPALIKQLEQILAQVPQGPVPVVAKQYNGLVALIVGTIDPSFEALLQANGNAVPGVRSLKNTLAFQDALKQVSPDPVAIAYGDMEAVVRLIESVVDLGDDRNAKAQWPKLRDALGLQGLKRVIWTGAFDGKDWADQSFVMAPAPRSGLMAMMDTAPISDDILKTVPKTSILMSAGKLGLGKIYTALHDGLKDFNADAVGQFDSVLDQVNQGLGVNIEKDVIDAFGDEWVLYSDEAIGGAGAGGLVVVNRLANPATAEKSFTAVENALNALIHDNMPDKKVTIAFRQTTSGSLTIHYLDVPLITPSWAVQDGNLYLALYPQVVEAAAAHVAAKGPTILENPAYLAVRERLGGQKATGIQFMDLPKTAPEGYGFWLGMSRLAAVGDIMGVQSPPMLLPPLYKLMPHFAPAGGVTWVDDAGWHAKAISPFPGSMALGNNQTAMGIAGPAMMISVLAPAVQKARESASHVKSTSNLRQIGVGCIMYANEHNGAFPPDLGSLVKGQDLAVDTFVSPRGQTQVPPDIRGQKGDDQAAWVNQNTDYIYVGAGKNVTAGADTAIAYEKPGTGKDGMTNVVFADGHVDAVGPEKLAQLVPGGGGKP